jgi:hypothetical protein
MSAREGACVACGGWQGPIKLLSFDGLGCVLAPSKGRKSSKNNIKHHRNAVIQTTKQSENNIPWPI